MYHQAGRRRFVRNSALALALPAIPMQAWAQTTLKKRVEWQYFKNTTQYDSLLKAIRLMKANTNANDPNSWAYWVNIHLNRCPHGVAYFLAWHRGYLYYFERQLQAVSGDPTLILPYWDYYAYATMPAEFTNSSATNPLYVDRLNVNVRQALTLAPFSSTLTNFQRGTTNAFEPSIENAPHNPVHDIIGNIMSTMQSPIDPIFWLHHANIDRLWVAWCAAGGGRKMPSTSNPYWSGSHIYTTTLSIARKSTYATRTTLQYYYQNESFPTSIPLAQKSVKNVSKVQATAENLMKSMPPVGPFKLSGPRETSGTTFSVGGAVDVGLDRRGVTAQLPIPAETLGALQNIMNRRPTNVPGGTQTYKSINIVLDDVELTELGKNGGYYYQVYLTFPASDGKSAGAPILIGTLGAFQIAGAAHHGHGAVQLRYLVERGLVGVPALRAGTVAVSFVRVDGDNSPSGPAIGIAEARLEVSTEDISP